MKISELIAELEKAMAEHGDMVVKVYASGCGYPVFGLHDVKASEAAAYIDTDG